MRAHATSHARHRPPVERWHWSGQDASPEAISNFIAVANGAALRLPGGQVVTAAEVDPEIDRYCGTLTLDVADVRFRAVLAKRAAAARRADERRLRADDVVRLHLARRVDR